MKDNLSRESPVFYNFSGRQVSPSLSPVSCFCPCTLLPLSSHVEIQMDIPDSLHAWGWIASSDTVTGDRRVLLLGRGQMAFDQRYKAWRTWIQTSWPIKV